MQHFFFFFCCVFLHSVDVKLINNQTTRAELVFPNFVSKKKKNLDCMQQIKMLPFILIFLIIADRQDNIYQKN